MTIKGARKIVMAEETISYHLDVSPVYASLCSLIMYSHPADRGATQRDDVPLPTQPPYTAFIGNLAFDLTEMELEDFFSPLKVSVFFCETRRF